MALITLLTQSKITTTGSNLRSILRCLKLYLLACPCRKIKSRLSPNLTEYVDNERICGVKFSIQFLSGVYCIMNNRIAYNVPAMQLSSALTAGLLSPLNAKIQSPFAATKFSSSEKHNVIVHDILQTTVVLPHVSI